MDLQIDVTSAGERLLTTAMQRLAKGGLPGIPMAGVVIVRLQMQCPKTCLSRRVASAMLRRRSVFDPMMMRYLPWLIVVANVAVFSCPCACAGMGVPFVQPMKSPMR